MLSNAIISARNSYIGVVIELTQYVQLIKHVYVIDFVIGNRSMYIRFMLSNAALCFDLDLFCIFHLCYRMCVSLLSIGFDWRYSVVYFV